MSIRQKLHALVDAIADEMERSGEGDPWVDQAHSPLGRERHLELARKGKLPAVKEQRRVLIRRSHIDAYLASKQVIVVNEEADDEREVAKVLAMVNGARR